MIPSRVLSITPFFHPSTKGQLVTAQWCPVAGWKLRCSPCLESVDRPFPTGVPDHRHSGPERSQCCPIFKGALALLPIEPSWLSWAEALSSSQPSWHASDVGGIRSGQIHADPLKGSERNDEGIVQDPFSQKFSAKTFLWVPWGVGNSINATVTAAKALRHVVKQGTSLMKTMISIPSYPVPYPMHIQACPNCQN